MNTGFNVSGTSAKHQTFRCKKKKKKKQTLLIILATARRLAYSECDFLK